ncbi:MAG: sodium/solute symporter, partial [Thermoguttaceae bacterium]|nr:sodium/solute symporter [Thermoguttaceae bacterium]
MTTFLFAQAAATGGVGNILDVLVFFIFLAAVIFVAFGMSRGAGGGAEDMFLGGRGLKWWLIGFSLIAANISAEQFVGMSGQGADYIGLAVASYEWIAALSLVIVAFFFLPRFLKAGIFTIPEYLEVRYNKSSRTIMSVLMMVMLVAVNITVVTFAGAKAYAVFFDGMSVCGIPLDLKFFCWAIGIFAALYVFAGGLKACAWADLLQGSALIAAGCVVLYFSLKKLGLEDPNVLAASAPGVEGLADKLAGAGAWERFSELNGDKLRMNLPSWDLVLPVTALIFAIWIPNLYYWGLNQYIIQRTLGANTLGDGQKGLVFAAFMKLLIPFIVIFPGMIAFNLFHNEMKASAAGKDEITRFEQCAKDGVIPEGAPLFTFNRSYAAINPENAKAMLDLNARALGKNAEDYLKLAANPRMTIEDQYELTLIAMKKSNPEAKFSGSTIGGYDADSAFPLLMSRVVPQGGFKGFMLAALLGAIVSSVAAMFNAASTIFTMDIYNEYFAGKTPEDEESKKKRQKKLVAVGRLAVVVFALIGCI